MASDDANRVKSATMPPRVPTVAGGFVTGMLSAIAPRDRTRLLAQSGLQLPSPEARVPLNDYAAFYNAVVAALDDEGFGLFPHPIARGTFEFLCRSLIGSRDLGEALERAARFLAIVLPELRVAIERRRETADIVIREVRRLRANAADPRRVFAFEWLLRVLHGVSCWLVGRALPLERVRFPYPQPAHAADYVLVYTEHSTFDAPALVATLESSLLDLPVRRDQADLAAFLEGAPGKITMVYRRDREMVPRVRELLSRSIASSLDDAARALALSPRTLHRRLHDEGSSFRALKDSARREIALRELERSRKSVADIAAQLGYSEPSAFFRAFHGWTGQAPSAHRRRATRPG